MHVEHKRPVVAVFGLTQEDEPNLSVPPRVPCKRLGENRDNQTNDREPEARA